MRRDHKLHFAAGLAIAAALGLWVSPLFGLGAGIAAGAGKEAYDLISGRGTPEWSDLFWTAIGAVAGAGAAWGLT